MGVALVFHRGYGKQEEMPIGPNTLQALERGRDGERNSRDPALLHVEQERGTTVGNHKFPDEATIHKP